MALQERKMPQFVFGADFRIVSAARDNSIALDQRVEGAEGIPLPGVPGLTNQIVNTDRGPLVGPDAHRGAVQTYLSGGYKRVGIVDQTENGVTMYVPSVGRVNLPPGHELTVVLGDAVLEVVANDQPGVTLAGQEGNIQEANIFDKNLSHIRYPVASSMR